MGIRKQKKASLAKTKEAYKTRDASQNLQLALAFD